MKVLCVFGRHAYGSSARGNSPEHDAFIPALRRAGHKVLLFDSWNREAYRDLAELNTKLLQTVEAERPEVMLFVPFTYEVWLETLWIIKERGDVTSICWTTDDSWKYEQQSKFIAPAFHAIATTYPTIYAKYQAAGIRHAFLTRWAAPTDSLAAPLPASRCSIRVSFVGAAHGNRKARIDRLKKRGVTVQCFGYGWPNGPLSADRMRQVFRESVISLNFANSRGENQIKARTFEVPGAGGFLLTETAPGLEDAYRVGTEIESFSSLRELEDKIRHYLSHPEERDLIATRGQQRTRQEHTYDIRLRDLFDFAEKARADSERPGPAKQAFNLAPAIERHRVTVPLRALRGGLIALAIVTVGPQRARRAARRLLYEVSWRLTGRRTFESAGLPGRLFPKD